MNQFNCTPIKLTSTLFKTYGRGVFFIDSFIWATTKPPPVRYIVDSETGGISVYSLLGQLLSHLLFINVIGVYFFFWRPSPPHSSRRFQDHEAVLDFHRLKLYILKMQRILKTALILSPLFNWHEISAIHLWHIKNLQV